MAAEIDLWQIIAWVKHKAKKFVEGHVKKRLRHTRAFGFIRACRCLQTILSAAG